jgi:hypothetical protein
MSEEKDDIERGIIRAADATECILDEGVVKAMNSFNTKLKKPRAEKKADTKPNTAQPNNSESQVNETEINSSSQS